MAVRRSTARTSSNYIHTDKTMFVMNTFGEYFSRSSAYHAIKKYFGNSRIVELSKANGRWVFKEIATDQA